MIKVQTEQYVAIYSLLGVALSWNGRLTVSGKVRWNKRECGTMFLSRNFRTTDFGIIKTKISTGSSQDCLAGKGQTKMYLEKESPRLCLGSRDLPANRSSEGATADLRLCWTPSLQMSGNRGNLLPCCASAIPGLQHRLAVKEGTNGFQTIPLLTIL